VSRVRKPIDLSDYSPRVNFSVDPSMHDEMHSLALEDRSGRLEHFVRKDLRFHYSGPICARRWISLCEDQSYDHQRLVTLIEAALPELLLALRADAGGPGPVDLVSLGPGSGAIDMRILHGIQARLLLGYYYCLDSSFELLCYAVSRILRDRKLRCLKIRAICGDFVKVRSICPPGYSDGHVRMFTLTGFTLGNFNEEELLKQVSLLMSRQDYLLLDAHLHNLAGWNGKRKLSSAERSTLLRYYRPDSVKRFVFGPVETVTHAKASDVPIEYQAIAKKTAIPRAVEIVIYCKSLDTTMRLTGRRIRRQRLDLACTALYGFPDLRNWFDSRGFKTIWCRDAGPVGFFLLRPGRGSSVSRLT
jgi:Histidine-specific methyltransferase, SAM-dependent